MRAISFREMLRETRGVLAGPRGAASRLGLKRTTLQYKNEEAGHHAPSLVASTFGITLHQSPKQTIRLA